jgi:hypothetical protein
LDRIVHIDNGSLVAKPIVLRLLPGEETIFNLKVVNHGAPSNISLKASDPVFKAVRLKTPDHHVGKEELIPIMVRMPDHKARLDGEIILTSKAGQSRVPVSLVRDFDVMGSDLTDPGLQGDRDVKVSLKRGNSNMDDEDLDEEAEDDEKEDTVREDERDQEADNDLKEDLDEDEAAAEDYGVDDDSEEDGSKNEVRRISFSRDRDLKRYKSANRPGIIEGIQSRRREMQSNGSASISDDDPAESRIDRIPRSRDSSPDHSRYIHRSHESLHGISEQGDSETISSETNAPEPAVHEEYRGFRHDVDSESREIISQAEEASEGEEEAGYEDYSASEFSGVLGNFGRNGATKMIPAAIFLALVSVLSMTFIFEKIPEFPGALGSSILIVTLIIYGAATLLKA